MTFSGDLRADTASRFAYDLSYIDTAAAAGAGVPAELQQISHVRVCRWNGADPANCTNETAPDTDRRRSRGVIYVFDLPAPGASTTVSLQLCNPRGCGDYVYVGTAVTNADARFYAVGSAFPTTSRVRPYALTTDVKRLAVEYSDGLLSEVRCDRVGVCATNALDATVALSATIRALEIDGAPISSRGLVLRGSPDELTGQRAQRPAPGGRMATIDAGVRHTTTATDGAINVRIGPQSQLSSPPTFSQPTDLVVSTLRGATLTVTFPRSGLATGTVYRAALLADIPDLVAVAPPPPGTQLLVGMHSTVTTLTGVPVGVLPQQVRVELALVPTLVPPGTKPRDLVVARWDGSRWVTVSDGAAAGADGSIKAQVWTTSPGLYAVMRSVAP